MIHHVSIGTNDVARARAFYDPLMTLLGFRALKDHATSCDYGSADMQFSVETPIDGRPTSAGNCVHNFTAWRSPMAGRMRGSQAFGYSMMPIIMAPSCMIPMAIR
jgi:catechol 2,3-dioxygenase-like lactoylglutathione lyase family enzyme